MASTVMTFEIIIFLLYKLIRGDLRYRLKLKGWKSWTLSLLMRIGVKIITDFTAMLHARHPLEMGGAYFLFNLVYTQCQLILMIYLQSTDAAAEAAKERGGLDRADLVLQRDDLIIIASVILSLWVLAIVLLLRFSCKGYTKTLLSFQTGKQFNRARFNTGDDEVMITIFKDHPSYYEDYQTEIVDWLEDRWQVWHTSQPTWLTKTVLDTVPAHLVPAREGINEIIEEGSPSMGGLGGGGGVGGLSGRILSPLTSHPRRGTIHNSPKREKALGSPLLLVAFLLEHVCSFLFSYFLD